MADTIVEITLWLLTVVFLVAPAFRVHASYVLWRAYRYEKENNLPTGTTLERFFVAVTGSVASIILGTLGFVRALWLLGIIQFQFEQPIPTFALGVALMLMVLPAFSWEYMYQTDRLGK